MKEKQKPEIDTKQFVGELIEQRALTMEDGRNRGELTKTAVQKPEAPKAAADDGDLL
jgi:hypothetical protein